MVDIFAFLACQSWGCGQDCLSGPSLRLRHCCCALLSCCTPTPSLWLLDMLTCCNAAVCFLQDRVHGSTGCSAAQLLHTC